MKLVLDTNVFISSFFWSGNPRKIMTRIIERKDVLFASNEILQEVFFVMSRPKFNVSHHQVVHFVNSIAEISSRVNLLGTVKGVCRDSDDDKILECAILGKVDFIITGDKDLLILKKFKEIPILSPLEYIEKIKKLID